MSKSTIAHAFWAFLLAASALPASAQSGPNANYNVGFRDGVADTRLDFIAGHALPRITDTYNTVGYRGYRDGTRCMIKATASMLGTTLEDRLNAASDSCLKRLAPVLAPKRK